MLLFIHPQSMARGMCQTRSTMHKLVTFVQLVLYWYNGFSQSVVMESDLFLRMRVVFLSRHNDQCEQRSDWYFPELETHFVCVYVCVIFW